MVTMDGAQGAELLGLVRPHRAVPVHHADYTVFTSGLDDFTDEVRRRGLQQHVLYVAPGETVTLPAAPA